MNDELAFFLTWTTYGTWLRGDERGWVKKPGQRMPPDRPLEWASRQRMTESELTLDRQQRDVVEQTVTEHCQIRRWPLHAVSCRTQHVHVVVTAPDYTPDRVLDEFKAYCTRRLKELQREREPGTKVRQKWWTRGGSKRRLYDDDSLSAAVEYVLEAQDGPSS